MVADRVVDTKVSEMDKKVSEMDKMVSAMDKMVLEMDRVVDKVVDTLGVGGNKRV